MSDEQLLLNLPQEKLPECWNDEIRMNVLFAPFRNRSVNPKDWDSKLLFWKNLISECCMYNKIYTFKIEDLQKTFNKNGRSPSCLNMVIEEMYKSGEIKTLEEFLKKPARTWSTWVTDVFIRKPIKWSYDKIKESLVVPTDHVYVSIPAIEKEAEKLLLTIPEELKNKVISLQELLDITETNITKVNGIKLILHHLMCIDKVDVREIDSNNKQELLPHNLLIKIGDMKKVKPISDVDDSIYVLEQNQKTLLNNLERLENEVVTLTEEAKMYLRKSQRQLAKSSLRKKHEVEKTITKRSNALQNIELLLMRLRDTDSDSQVLDSLKLALSSLRKGFKESDLTEDSVFNTVSELGDVLNMHEEIQHTLSLPLTNDDVDLEEELAELLKSSKPPTPPEPAIPTHSVEDTDIQELEKRLEKLRSPGVISVTPTTPIKMKTSE